MLYKNLEVCVPTQAPIGRVVCYLGALNLLNSSQYLYVCPFFYCQKLLNLGIVVSNFPLEGLELMLALKMESREGLF